MGKLNVNGLDYERGVWEIHLKNHETVMINNVNVNVSTTTKDIEENTMVTTATTEMQQLPYPYENNDNVKFEVKYTYYDKDGLMIYFIVKGTILAILLVYRLYYKYCKSKRERENIPYSEFTVEPDGTAHRNIPDV